MKRLVHFLLLGGVAWLAFAGSETARPRLVVPANGAVDEAVLHRAALAAGLDGADEATRTRLAGVAAFLSDGAVEDRDALAAEARRLGLAETDVVARRHLVQMMQLALRAPEPSDLPTDADVAEWIAAHADSLREPPRVRLVHVYFARAARGAHTTADAIAALAVLRSGGAVPGDAFLAGATLGPASAADVARALGPAVADATATAPVGDWIGPLESPWGVHLVRVEERTPGAMPPLALVRSQVVHHILAERSAARAETRLAALRARWDIVRDPSPTASGR